MANINSGRRSSMRNMDATTGTDEEAAEVVEEEPKSTLEASIPMISTITHVVLFGYFLSATILTSISDLAAYVDAIYDSIPLGCASVAMFVGIVMNISDFRRTRFSSVQRMLYSVSALILWTGCIVMIALPPSSTEVVSGDLKPTIVDIVTVVCLSIYAILAIVEGRIIRKPKVQIKDGKKIKKLNKR